MSVLHRKVDDEDVEQELCVRPLYAQTLDSTVVPRYQLGQHPMPPDTALAVIRDELLLDGNARQNLATFCTSWMEPQARELMADCIDRNMIDKDEYPQTTELEHRCVNILAHLWHARPEATGCSTAGSSEAAMLAGLALKWRWRQRMGAHGGAPGVERPNLVTGGNVHVCWPKFCRYWDVKHRVIPMSRNRTTLDPDLVAEACDSNTIGVVAVMGSTEDGRYDPIAEIAARLDMLQAETGLNIPIHVDGASGGFVAPFLQPDTLWDFRLPRVGSINTSGHKYGLVYPNIGWMIWRDSLHLPDDLVFRVNYLGGELETFTLNFSRSGAPIAAQYYNLLRLGHNGYRMIQQNCQDVARYLAREIDAMSAFELLSDGSDLPVVAFTLREDITNFSVYDLTDRLRANGWQIPAYPLHLGREELPICRIVVRHGFTTDLAEMLVEHLRLHTSTLLKHPHPSPPTTTEQSPAFHH
ncbi:glutamate decarboxylase [Kitasatospora sp. GAS204A]|uniref:glutamate decarboxylase n=1 Tax=unclassified Kitasatospora TaxID=2633591 RepID=UPI0024737B1B|nr:glutamate decarboxylase [Kitasatospora sp. GAS204B]MDH6119766.1 glutamate decarboxylase [Kitasatospora sp. GAS204B]